MKRRTLAIILLILGLIIGIITPILAFSPLGSQLFATQIATPPPTFLPFTPTPTPPPKPVLTVVGTPPPVNVKAAYLLDTDTGHTLDDFHGEVPLPMASTTKIMTAIIAIETGKLDTVVTITRDDVNEAANNGGSTAQLQPGDKISVKNLLYGLLLPSGDDAAFAIARTIGGSQDNFVRLMNIFAYRLHLYQTHYINADGLTYYSNAARTQPLPGHYTTAYDLARLAQYAMNIPLFAAIVKAPTYTLPATAGHHSYHWTNTNDLLGANPADPNGKYAGATGIKTGHTIEAGYCLVFSAIRSDHHLIGVILFSSDGIERFTDAQKLLNWGFGLPVRLSTS